MEQNQFKVWFRLGLFNLLLVALYGMLMRYKIAFDFPFFDQRNLLHAHSHFAFSGWISHVLYSGLAVFIGPFLPVGGKNRYHLLLIANMVSAVGMLAAFTVQGYKPVSIAFSTLNIVVGAAFAWVFIRDTMRFLNGHAGAPWAVLGVCLNVLSSAGPLALAYSMATNSIDPDWYLGSVYFYLHFQYNGWFFFGSVALVAEHLNVCLLKKYFRVFSATVFPTFFLSVLWFAIPGWLYFLTAGAAVVQLGTWIVLLVTIRPKLIQLSKERYPRWIKILFYVSLSALTIKFLLQAASAIPSLSQLVFGFRPVVIAYLHLVLLGVYTAFMIGYLAIGGFIRLSNFVTGSVFVFLSGIGLNELLLAVQGFAAFGYLPVPYINEMLFGAAALLFVGAAGLWMGQRERKMLK